MINPWLSIDKNADSFVLAVDKNRVSEYSETRQGEKSDFRLITSVVPEPWCGAINSARVIVLSGNPHWDERDEGLPVVAHEAMWENLSGDKPLYWLRPELAETTGSIWYRKKLLKNVLEDCDELAVQRGLCLVDYIGYRSHRWDQRLTLPSQSYTAFQIRQAMARNCVIVVTRGWAPWTGLIPELFSYNRCFHNSSVQNVRISRKNTSDMGFEAVTGALS